MYNSCPELILRLLSYFNPILLPTKIALTASLIMSSIHLLIQPTKHYNQCEDDKHAAHVQLHSLTNRDIAQPVKGYGEN
jgi:hypothetical protein